jgi:hypothetical protein
MSGFRFSVHTPARTWDWPRTRRYDDLSNDPDPSSPRQFCPDYIIATPGYDFQEGQVTLFSVAAFAQYGAPYGKGKAPPPPPVVTKG